MRQRTLVHQLLGTAIFALLSITVTGQQQTAPSTPAPTTPNNPGTPTPGTRTPTPTTPTQPGQQRTPDQLQFPEMQRPMFLSGKVVMEDGSAPPESVTIERVCNGVPRPEGVTDSKGRFSFELGRNTGMFMDASVSSPDFGPGAMGGGRQNSMGGPNMGIRERDLLGCELRAALPGFRSEVVNLSGRRFLENPDIGTIVLRRMGNVEGLTISATSLAAPKEARKAFEKAREAAKKNKLEDAQKQYEKAIELYPRYAAAWNELGQVHERRKDTEAARKAFSEALTIDQKFISPYEGLAQIAARENKWQDVADITDRMLRLNPVDFPRAYFFNAVANLNLQRLDDAEKSAVRLLEMDPHHKFAKAEHVLGLILAQKQDYEGAAVHIRKFIAHAPAGADLDLAKKQLGQLEEALASRVRQQ
jgi:hypothetical protein